MLKTILIGLNNFFEKKTIQNFYNDLSTRINNIDLKCFKCTPLKTILSKHENITKSDFENGNHYELKKEGRIIFQFTQMEFGNMKVMFDDNSLSNEEKKIIKRIMREYKFRAIPFLLPRAILCMAHFGYVFPITMAIICIIYLFIVNVF